MKSPHTDLGEFIALGNAVKMGITSMEREITFKEHIIAKHLDIRSHKEIKMFLSWGVFKVIVL